MSKAIVFERPDGMVRVVSPVEPMAEGESEEEYLSYVAGVARRKNPTLANAVVRGSIPLELIPSTRFRGFTVIDQKTGSVITSAPSALRWVDGGLAIDLDAAKTQLLAETRFVRDAKLKESDAEHARLSEIGTPEQKKILAEKRQALRDLPAAVSAKIATMTLAELETFKTI